ncbi:S-layer family protein [Miniimonas sp. S16]|uniref:beta strand repeat-containing protein n=1 Tax=Miniimonas sp. S16 TaxID=2171623 RepID=UPI000D529149|nr:PKD domain-containing protein [Miniimonas sp. S16]
MNTRTLLGRAVATVVATSMTFFGITAMAAADSKPLDPTNPATPTTVTADILPTVQVNGVVWAQAVVGNTVYAVGSFTKARPAGSALGQNEVDRSNILAYDIRTGNLIDSFAPVLNGQARDIEASPDGKRIYVVGDFSQVNGQWRVKAAAFDTATNTLVANWRPTLASNALSVAATNTTVYIGGDFVKAASVTGGTLVDRKYLAAFNASDGSLTSFVGDANASVTALTLNSTKDRLVVGGRFTTLAGSDFYGLGSLDPVTGAPQALPANAQIRNAGDASGITSLTADADGIYGSGYHFGAGGNTEGTFMIDNASGTLDWVADCHGDTYGVFPQNGVVYSASHAHYCGNIGGFPQTDPWTFHHSQAFSKAATTVNTADIYGYQDHPGQPAPSLLSWENSWTVGTYTGMAQAGFSIAGNSQYVVYGGEFKGVNGVAQQGLVRFTVPSNAANKGGPVRSFSTWVPTATSQQAGEVRFKFPINWDRDNATLTYKVYRGSTLVSTQDITHNFWDSQINSKFVTVKDTGATPGSTQTYYVTATDPFGNTARSNSVTVTVSNQDLLGAYGAKVLDDGATNFWPLSETSGSDVINLADGANATAQGGVTRGVTGAILSHAGTASHFSGSGDGLAVANEATSGSNVFSAEAWIRTTSTSGGKILGFGGSNSGNSGSYDRHVYMTNDGRIIFGVYPNEVRTVGSSTSYNDGQWHHVVATLGPNGQTLYVDGKRVGQRSDTTTAQSYTGYWRIGGDNIGGWPDQPSSFYFNGDIDDVAIYPSVLTTAQVRDHYTTAGYTLPENVVPTDAYGRSVVGAEPDVYWRYSETSGSVLTDTSGNSNDGALVGATARTSDGALFGSTGSGLQIGPDNGWGYTTRQFSSPGSFTLETWFKTSSTSGGRLIGFGDGTTNTSGSYDRQVYMERDGQLTFGTWTGQTNTVTSPKSYNDGTWHHVMAVQGASGLVLYVDGDRVGTNPQTSAQDYSGHWRIGGDNNWGSGGQTLNATVDETAIYGTALTWDDAILHYALGTTGQPPVPEEGPTATFDVHATDLAVTVDALASSDPNDREITFAWDFGDGTTATGATASHTYATGGDKTVSLTVTNSRGLSATTTRTVTVLPANVLPTAAFTPTVTDLTVAADASASADSDGAISTYAWEFGDGATATGASTSHTYADSGTFTVKLVVTDNRGGTATVSHDVTVVKPNLPPTVDFTLGVNELAVSVDGSASADPEGTALGFAWDFGDGAHATGATAQHTYAARGSYDVTLVVTDGAGKTATKTVRVTVAPANVGPTAAFSVTTNGLRLSVDGSQSSDPEGDALTYAWDFGDGAHATGATAEHIYSSSDTYTVGLTVTDGSGASGSTTSSVTVVNADPTALFSLQHTALAVSVDASASSDPEGRPLTYAWSFGDGATGSGAAASHTYATAGTYTVTLTVTDANGGSAHSSQQVTVVAANQAPTASFTVALDGLSVSADGTGSSDPENGALTYAWSFGDGATATGATTSHTYASAGQYTVTLTVSDPLGATGSTTRSVTVVAPNRAPVALFSSSVSDLAVSVNGSGSSDPEGAALSYAWDFGDGATGTGVASSHSYAAAGTYTVTLVVTDDKGATGTVSAPVTVTAPPATSVVASDAFGRTTANGWGSADAGGAWTLAGAASRYATNGSAGTMTLTAGGSTFAQLGSVSARDVDVTTQLSFGSRPSASTVQGFVSVRASGQTSDYRAKAIVNAAGVVVLQVSAVNTTETSLAYVIVPGITYTPGQVLNVRFQAEGTGTTTLRAKVWAAGASEPSAWQANVTDSTDALQDAGTLALASWAGSTIGAFPFTTTFDNYKATTIGAPAPNAAPVALFSSSVSDLAVSVNGSGSSDPEGAALSYAWDFGDGATGTGVASSHSYAAAGTYTVTLVVTDDKGATGTVSAPVTVTAPPATSVVASDAFGRTTANGWGSADAGGAWTLAGAASRYATNGSAGTMTLTAGGSTFAQLGSVSARDVDVTTQLSFGSRPSASTVQGFVSVRASGQTSDYRAKAIVNAAGVVVLQVSAVNTTETSLAYVIVPGITYTPGQVLNVRFQAEGTGTTTLRAKVWAAGASEPSAWQANVTDSTDALQDAGTLALASWAGSTIGAFPFTTTFDNYNAVALG